MMTRTQLRDDLLAKLGQETPASATSGEQGAVVQAVNSALQLLWVAGASYFLRQSISVTLVAGAAAYVLSATAQTANGPVRLANGQSLRRFDTRGQLDDYALEVSGEASRTVADGTPFGYLIEHGIADDIAVTVIVVSNCAAPFTAVNGRYSPNDDFTSWVQIYGDHQIRKESGQWTIYNADDDRLYKSGVTLYDTAASWGSLLGVKAWHPGLEGPADGAPMPHIALEGDVHAMTLRLRPAPNAGAVTAGSPLTIEGVIECPSYEYSDLASGVVPVPEGYVETYLLPLARAELTRSHLFSRKDLAQSFDADAARAMSALGLADAQAEATGDTGKVGKQTKKGAAA